jgi:hypothetical protein
MKLGDGWSGQIGIPYWRRWKKIKIGLLAGLKRSLTTLGILGPHRGHLTHACCAYVVPVFPACKSVSPRAFHLGNRCDIVFHHEDCIQSSDYSSGRRSRVGGRARETAPVRRKLHLPHLFLFLRRRLGRLWVRQDCILRAGLDYPRKTPIGKSARRLKTCPTVTPLFSGGPGNRLSQ